MDDVYVYVVALPPGIHEMIAPCEGGYTIYIDDSLSNKGRLDALKHAIVHIKNNDFEKEDVQEIEWDSHYT